MVLALDAACGNEEEVEEEMEEEEKGDESRSNRVVGYLLQC